MDLYNADPNLPGTYPLYILSSDGYVLERWKPVSGYLDVSDVKHLITFTTPQTISTVSNQQWRIFSTPIVSNGNTIGIITVSTISPDDATLGSIDEKLRNAAYFIASKMRIQNNNIDTSQLDSRQIDYTIAFQVVNSFNIIVAKNNNNNSTDRIPNFIDNSYVSHELQQQGTRIISDNKSHEQFLITNLALYNGQNIR